LVRWTAVPAASVGTFPDLFDAILADAGIDAVLSDIQLPRAYRRRRA
jgi:hypothetical protein